ncbi:MAG: hypothetical protein H6Q58_604 [Firmicutes bacterium]|nr:hypothetical protein [Bacillota bacterium]
MENTNKQDNFHVFFNTIKRYIILLVIVTVAGAGAVGVYLKAKPPMYLVERQLKINTSTLETLDRQPGEVIYLDKIYENISQQEDLQQVYKSKVDANAGAEGIEAWAKDTLEITQNQSIIAVKSSTNDKELSEALSVAYYNALDSVVKDIATEVYNEKIDYNQRKIGLINQKIQEISGGSAANDFDPYTESLNILAEAQIMQENYISPLELIQTQESTVTTSKKALLSYMIMGAATAFMAGIFFIFLFDYAKGLKKNARKKAIK